MKHRKAAKHRRRKPTPKGGRAAGADLFPQRPADEGRQRPAGRVKKLLTGWPMAVALVGCYWLLAVTSASQKSVTSDETVHLPAGFTYWKYNDYRMNPENGNLAQRWMALPLVLGDCRFPFLGTTAWDLSKEWHIGHYFLYQVGNDPDKILWQGRAMIAVLGAALGLLVYAWSRRLFGPVGGMVSLVMFAFDPTMLAHGRLATSDVAAGLFFCLSLGCLWIMLHKVSPWTVLASSLVMGGLFLAKMSGALSIFLGLMLIGVRLATGRPLEVTLGRTWHVAKRRSQALVFLGTIVFHAAVVLLLIWTAYGFRYSMYAPPLTGREQPDRPWEMLLGGGEPTTKAIQFARDHKLLPEGYLYGFAHVYRFSRKRSAFFRGQYGNLGWRSYFPYCFLVKTPLPTMAIVILAGIAAVLKCRSAADGKPPLAWLTAAKGLYRTAPLWIFLAVYWTLSIFSHLNIGHRHILPTYAPLYILSGAAGYWLLTRLRWTHVLLGLLGLVLVVKSLSFWPHYLAYFNPLEGGPKKAYRYVVDSSLDWGQDLPTLKRWLDKNAKRGEDVYLSFFGNAKVAHYGIDATRLRGVPDWERTDLAPALGPGIYCVSATMLQVVLIGPWGPWNTDYEYWYQTTLKNIPQLAATRHDPAGRRKFIQSITDPNLVAAIRKFDQLQFARLAAYLRQREPDDSAGYSILIYRLSQQDIRDAMDGPPAELKPRTDR